MAMSDRLDKLERTLDRQMGLLADHLRTPDPHSECIERVKAAVAQEAVRVEQQARRLRLFRRWGAVAAALLLAASLGWPPPSGPTADLCRQTRPRCWPNGRRQSSSPASGLPCC